MFDLVLAGSAASAVSYVPAAKPGKAHPGGGVECLCHVVERASTAHYVPMLAASRALGVGVIRGFLVHVFCVGNWLRALR
eukprot:1520408-Pyramimonas_sp.AAC.1